MRPISSHFGSLNGGPRRPLDSGAPQNSIRYRGPVLSLPLMLPAALYIAISVAGSWLAASAYLSTVVDALGPNAASDELFSPDGLVLVELLNHGVPTLTDAGVYAHLWLFASALLSLAPLDKYLRLAPVGRRNHWGEAWASRSFIWLLTTGLGLLLAFLGVVFARGSSSLFAPTLAAPWPDILALALALPLALASLLLAVLGALSQASYGAQNSVYAAFRTALATWAHAPLKRSLEWLAFRLLGVLLVAVALRASLVGARAPAAHAVLASALAACVRLGYWHVCKRRLMRPGARSFDTASRSAAPHDPIPDPDA